MSEIPHFFKLKVTKGDQTVEVEMGGGEKFVAPAYQDVKAEALAFLHREAAQAAITDQPAIRPPLLIEQPAPSPAIPTQTTATPSHNPPPPPHKPKKTYAPKTEEKSTRKSNLEKVRVGTFDDIDRYTAAIQSADNPSDRGALVTNMAHDKFGIDGLSPAEVRWLLAEKFKVGQDKRALEEAMKAQPTSFYLVAVADYDKRQRLYRPVKGCIDRVQTLLRKHDGISTPTNGNGAVTA